MVDVGGLCGAALAVFDFGALVVVEFESLGSDLVPVRWQPGTTGAACWPGHQSSAIALHRVDAYSTMPSRCEIGTPESRGDE